MVVSEYVWLVRIMIERVKKRNINKKVVVMSVVSESNINHRHRMRSLDAIRETVTLSNSK